MGIESQRLISMTTTESEISYVIFDVFGTLIEFRAKHHPFRQLLKWARENGRQVRPTDARTIMTINGNVKSISAGLGVQPSAEFVSHLEVQIQDEISGLNLFDDAAFVLDNLIQQGVRVGICSNLAQPYGAAIDRLLSGFEIERFLSYELAYVKPESEIYDAICDRFKCAPRQCLFVGDTFDADYLGPKEYGMHALHLVRNGKSVKNQIKSLLEVPTYINTGQGSIYTN